MEVLPGWALIKKSVFMSAGGLAEGPSALITLRQRSSTDLFVNAQSGQIFLEMGSTGSPGNPDQGPDQAAEVLSERTARQPALKRVVSHRVDITQQSLGPVQHLGGGVVGARGMKGIFS